MSHLSAPHFHNEEPAYAFVEARVWPNGPTCPKCGERERVSKMKGKSTRIGIYKCYKCRNPFTVKMGTIFESSHVKMHLWLQAIYLMCASKKGMSSNQLFRILGVTLKTAWYMSHRIREAMRSGDLVPLGANGSIVESDETFIGKEPNVEKPKNARSFHHKMKVLSLVDRATGRARSFVVNNTNKHEIVPILRSNISKEARVMTDEAPWHRLIRNDFAKHGTVDHSLGEYVNGSIHTNTVEGYFSIFKRGMKGVYQHCSKAHLHRYAAEFDFRYSTRNAVGIDDAVRTDLAVKGIVGRRLTYQTIGA